MLVTVTGEHDDGYVVARAANRRQERQAVRPGEVVVEKDAVERPRLEECERFRAARGLRDIDVEARAAQRPPNGLAIDVVVVDDENAPAYVRFRQGSSTSVQYLFSVAMTSQKLENVTGLRR
jgi:hypothetical protein